MTVGWLIDAEMFENYREELVAEIRAQGHAAKLIQAPRPPFRWDDIGCSYRETFPQDACVIAHGDIDLVTRIERERRWIPGAFCTVENYFWSNYVCWFGKFVLNHDYIMLPFGDLLRSEEFLFDTLGREDQVFVRPDSPLKLFAGQAISRKSYAADVDFLGFYEFPPSTLVVVSSPKAIFKEWRFVVVEDKVIAGCQYRMGDSLSVTSDYDTKAFDLAQAIASLGYAPDPVWVMDICQTEDTSFHLLEIGAFSFADLYACDKKAIVAAVSAVAHSVWKRSRGS